MTTPEQAIWQTVLVQAVNDALIGVTGNESGTRKAKIEATRAARRYFTEPHKDFATVCTIADLDPVAVREAMIKRIAAAPTPEELFTGSRRRDHDKSVKLTHEGQTRTLNAWAKITGISTNTLRNRVRKGWDAKTALTTPVFKPSATPKPKAKRSTAKMLTHNGKTKTVAQWSKITGIPAPVLHMRERSGWDAEKIITTPYTPRGTTVIRLTYQGETLTIPEWSERTGVAIATIKQRRRNGMPIDRVLSSTVQMGRPRGVVCDFGEGFGTGGGRSLQERLNINFAEDALT